MRIRKVRERLARAVRRLAGRGSGRLGRRVSRRRGEDGYALDEATEVPVGEIVTFERTVPPPAADAAEAG